jgi:hypothetical protein
MRTRSGLGAVIASWLFTVQFVLRVAFTLAAYFVLFGVHLVSLLLVRKTGICFVVSGSVRLGRLMGIFP